MLEPCLKVHLVDDFVLVNVEQVKQLVYLFVYILVFDYSTSPCPYIEIMAKN